MKTFAQLEIGQYYIPVFERIEPLDVFGNLLDTHNTDSPIYKYLGGMEFVTEDGDPVEGFYDPELGCYVNVDAADGFVQ